jgi:catechol 2,3-dioxygenase-like lactoylglutathione lyase family enzyme
MPRLNRILETALYVDDLDASHAFYAGIMGLPRVLQTPTLWAYQVGDHNILLLFRKGASLAPQSLHGGLIPAHDGSGPVHLCFGTTEEEMVAWEETLGAHAIEIEGRVSWPEGGRSIYFRDPDQHMLEIMTPGLWRVFRD